MRISVAKMYKLFIGGKFTRTESERYTDVFSPRTESKICNISRASRKDIRNSVVAARNGFNEWNSKSGYERAQILYRLAEMLEERKEQFAKSIYDSTRLSSDACMTEVNAATDRIIFYAGLADKWQQISGTVNPVQSGYFNFSMSEATGIVGIILPEEPSFLPLVSRLCTSLVTGNAVIAVSSERAPLPSLTFAEVIATSDFPAGAVNILTGKKKEIVSHLAGHYDVNAIDYCDHDPENSREVMSLCSNNVKRFHAVGLKWDWRSEAMNENIYEPAKFVETKTVWHTMGM
jgi:acyl-CoA reductase-like NAD-dependent aldehyde dehydrogenase